jgi:hypothetical protein
LVMNQRRFEFLIRCIWFDDRTTDERKKQDRLAPITDVFAAFVENCKKCYLFGENVTIDEKLESFRGRCGFKQYISSKPNKYGIKFTLQLTPRCCIHTILRSTQGNNPMVRNKSAINRQMSKGV